MDIAEQDASLETCLKEQARRKSVAHDLDSCGTLHQYTRAAWHIVEPATTFIDNWHLGAIAEHLEATLTGQIRRLLITMPPRHLKSGMVSVMFPTYVWGPRKLPHHKFLYTSYAEVLSIRDAVRSRRIIQSPWYQDRWGEVFQLTGDQNAKTRYDNNRSGYRIASSVGGIGTGEGGNCLPAGSMISTPSGECAIERIQAGDIVFAFDSGLGKVVKRRVIATTNRDADALYRIYTSSGHSFRCTGNHQVFVPQKGYIPADRLMVGDRTVEQPSSENGAIVVVRQLRQADQETIIRDKESLGAGKQGFLLQQCVQPSAPRSKKLEAMHNMRWPEKRTLVEILFDRMQDYWSRAQAKNKAMSALRHIVSRLDGLLFPCVRGCCSLNPNDGFEQFAFQGIGAILEPISADAFIDSGKRPQQMCGVWSSELFIDGYARQAATTHTDSSYRREYAEQQATKSNFSLHAMSSAASSWTFGAVTKIEKYRVDPQPVYDIQVEGCSNFFVEGILVHNSVIVDDAHSLKEIDSEIIREGVIEWWDNVMPSRLNDPKKDTFIIVMQRGHFHDLAGHVLKEGGYEHLSLPAEFELDKRKTVIGWSDPRKKKGELLWPARFGAPELSELKKRLGPYGAASQLQQRPVPQEGGIFKKAWFKLWPHDAKLPVFTRIIQSYDTAFTDNTANDPSAGTTWGLFKHPKYKDRLDVAPMCIVLLDAWSEHLDWTQVRKKVRAEARARFGEDQDKQTNPGAKVDTILIENKGSGITLIRDLHMVGIAATPYNPKNADKTTRAYAATPFCAAGLVYMLESSKNHGEPVSWALPFIDQMLRFAPGRNANDRDDYVDTFTQVVIYLRDQYILEAAAGPDYPEDLESDYYKDEPMVNPYAR